MDKKLLRVYLVEAVGTFALVYFAAGVVLINHMTTVAAAGHSVQPATNTLTAYQPGIVGIALAQGLILAVLLALTVPVSGGYLNPAVTIMLWVFNRLETMKTVWFLGAQLVGAAAAGLMLKNAFDPDILQNAHFATPHLSDLAYGTARYRTQHITGTAIEFVLTFFLVLAMFGLARPRAQWGAAAAGAVMTAGVLFAFPLTGAATNPARWFGCVLWEAIARSESVKAPLADAFVYIAGPVIGALAAGLFCFKVYQPALEETGEATGSSAETPKPTATAIKTKKP